jgi:hypothetical protein
MLVPLLIDGILFLVQATVRHFPRSEFWLNKYRKIYFYFSSMISQILPTYQIYLIMY